MPDMAFPSGCWSHFYDLKTDTPPKVNKTLKQVVSARWTSAMVETVLMDRREAFGEIASVGAGKKAPVITFNDAT
jgi:hypothetical protein